MDQISEQERSDLLSEAIAKLTKACNLLDEIGNRLAKEYETEKASITN